MLSPLHRGAGLQLVVSGYSDKLPLFAEKVCAEVRNFVPDRKTFKRVYDLLRREMLGWETQQPYFHCAYYAAQASETLQFPIEVMRAALGRATLEMQKGFLQQLLSTGSYGNALIIGNVGEAGAQSLLSIGRSLSSPCFFSFSFVTSSLSFPVEKSFPFPALSASERVSKRVFLYPAASTEVPLGSRIAKPEPNRNDANSVTHRSLKGTT